MRKLPVFCLALAAVFYSSSAFSRICFLADLDCQEGKFAVEDNVSCLNRNSSWIFESQRCESLEYGAPVCNDSTGNYYEERGCKSGYTDLSGDNKRICSVNLTCGSCCPDDKVQCGNSYQICTNDSKPSTSSGNDSCEDKDGLKFLECDNTVYTSKCDAKGLVPDTSNMYTDSNGSTWYSSCKCATGYTQTPLSNIKCSEKCANNCRLGTSVLLPGTSSYCWEGAECLDDENKRDTCPISYQSDFDKFWSGYDVNGQCGNLTVNCEALGYNSGTADIGTKCKDGTEPYRCPFDHTKVYCETTLPVVDCSGFNLTFCPLTANCDSCFNGALTRYKITSCKDGYTLKDGKCEVSVCTYSLTYCPTGGVCDSCKSDDTTKYKLTGCASGYALDGNSCYNCTRMYSTLNQAFSSRDYYLYCDLTTGYCKSDTTTCQGDIGSRGWNNPCICNIIGTENCFSFDAGDKVPATPGSGSDSGKTCLRSDIERCQKASYLMEQALEKHNRLCPAYKVTRHQAYGFHCTAYMYQPSNQPLPSSHICTQMQ